MAKMMNKTNAIAVMRTGIASGHSLPFQTERRSQVAIPRFTIERGRSQRQPNSRIWSVRMRWSEALTQTKTANNSHALSNIQTRPGITVRKRIGRGAARAGNSLLNRIESPMRPTAIPPKMRS
jgi:hypothetical protein